MRYYLRIGNVGWSLRLMYISAAKWSMEIRAELMIVFDFFIPKHVVMVLSSPWSCGNSGR
jgi:hypothetical protein